MTAQAVPTASPEIPLSKDGNHRRSVQLSPSRAALNPKLITAKELADRYSVTPKVVRKWARLGILPVVKFNSRCVRFDVEKCDEAVEKRTVRA